MFTGQSNCKCQIGFYKHVPFPGSGRLTGSLLHGYRVCHCHLITSHKLLVCGIGFLPVINVQVQYLCLANEVNVKLEYPGHIILICEQLKKYVNLHSRTLREVVTPQYVGLPYQKVLLVDPRSKASGPSVT